MSHRCEALVLIKDKYIPCGTTPADLHHKLTRARGGKILDQWGETYHQMWLCREHHDYAHDNPEAYEAGLMLRGSVVTNTEGFPVYTGPDEFLSNRYGVAG